VEQQAQMHLQVYDAVMKSRDNNDARKQKVATSLVVAILTPDDSMRLGLLDVLKNEAAAEVKKQASDALDETTKFVAEQQTVAPASASSLEQWTCYKPGLFAPTLGIYPQITGGPRVSGCRNALLRFNLSRCRDSTAS
jgi:hypothetical protein